MSRKFLKNESKINLQQKWLFRLSIPQEDICLSIGNIVDVWVDNILTINSISIVDAVTQYCRYKYDYLYYVKNDNVFSRGLLAVLEWCNVLKAFHITTSPVCVVGQHVFNSANVKLVLCELCSSNYLLCEYIEGWHN